MAEIPNPPPTEAKPKRKYTVSGKSRASSANNLKQARTKYVFTPARRAASMKALEKARAAPPEKRNRSTLPRLLARFANLCLAHLKLGPAGKRSPAHIYHGTSCRHLEHSVGLAGESKAALEAHRDRFQRAFRPRDGEDSRLVRGMADAAWRLLRAFGVRARWEMRAVQYRLLAIIAERDHRQAEGGADGPASQAQKPEPGQLALAIHKLLVDLGESLALFQKRDRLRHRLEQLLRAFLSRRLGAPSSFHFFTREGSRLPDFEHLPDFALGNPDLPPKKARQHAEKEAAGPKELKPAKDWLSKVGTDPARQLTEDENYLRHHLLRATGYNDALDRAGLEQLLAQALGIDDFRLSMEDSGFGIRGSGFAEEKGDPGLSFPDSQSRAPFSSTKSETETPKAGPFANPEPRNPNPGSSIDNRQSSISALAGQLWERLRLFRDWQESEARELDEVLERAVGPQGVETWEPKLPPWAPPTYVPGPEEASPHWQWRALAALVLAVFADDTVPLAKAGAFMERATRAIHSFLVQQYGQCAGFDVLEPDPDYQPPPWWGAEQIGARIRREYAGGPRVLPRVLRL